MLRLLCEFKLFQGFLGWKKIFFKTVKTIIYCHFVNTHQDTPPFQ